MCPACAASGAMVLAGVTSAGGLTAFLARIFFWRRDRNQVAPAQKNKEKP